MIDRLRLVSLVLQSQGRFTLENIFCGFVTNLALGTVITKLTNQINNQSIIPSTDVIQLTLTLKMTTAQVFETSVTVNNNSTIQGYVHPDDQTQPSFEMTPGFKPFTVVKLCCSSPYSFCYAVIIHLSSSSYKYHTKLKYKRCWSLSFFRNMHSSPKL